MIFDLVQQGIRNPPVALEKLFNQRIRIVFRPPELLAGIRGAHETRRMLPFFVRVIEVFGLAELKLGLLLSMSVSGP